MVGEAAARSGGGAAEGMTVSGTAGRLRDLAVKGMACLVAGVAMLGLASAESDIRVYMDYARVLKLDRSVSKVIIGNPEIADVTVSDPQTIVLTGRSFGATNLVILDNAGTALVDERVVVTRDEANSLRVYRNTAPQLLKCAPVCEEPSAGGAALGN
jgi:Flp pilus assembly secretin CpaC